MAAVSMPIHDEGRIWHQGRGIPVVPCRAERNRQHQKRERDKPKSVPYPGGNIVVGVTMQRFIGLHDLFPW